MTRLHEGHDLTAELAEIHHATVELADWVRREGRGDEGLAQDAFQESVEASLLGAVLAQRKIPGPQELGVDPEPYLLGLGDLVGEVRRLALDRIADGDVAAAEEYLHLMDQLHHTLMRFDTTRGIVALKPKQDVARALLERTRGEVTMARLLGRFRPAPPAPSGAPE